MITFSGGVRSLAAESVHGFQRNSLNIKTKKLALKFVFSYAGNENMCKSAHATYLHGLISDEQIQTPNEHINEDMVIKKPTE